MNVGNVQLTKLPDVGVPNNGVTRVGEVLNTTSPVPVLLVTPVPPLSTGKAVPEYVSASVPDPLTGEPPTVKNAGAVNPTDVTVPPPFVELIVTFGHVPVTLTLVPAVIDAVVEPVPPLAIGKAVPEYETANVPDDVIDAGVTLRNAGTVIPIEVTLPVPLLLNVVQSVALRTPLFRAEAVGTFKVITGVVVPVATALDKSVPVVPKVRADTDVTVPLPPATELIV